MEENLFNKFLEQSNSIADINSATAILGWDQETYMPDGAVDIRAEQTATLSKLVHRLTVDENYGKMIDELSNGKGAELEPWQKNVVVQTKKDRDKASKFPEEFIHEAAKVMSHGNEDWKKARRASDFSLFQNSLEKIVDIKRREADYIGFKDNPYDALLNEFEEGMTVTQLKPIFERLRIATIRLLEKVKNSTIKPTDNIIHAGFDTKKQIEFSESIIKKLGFDFNFGRIDLTTHPFCTSFGMTDVRLTTRVYENDLRSCLFGLIHESGHGMYEQGFDKRYARTSVASGTSMGIHESQSLFWENMVSRSSEFWEWAFPILQNKFPEKLNDINSNEFYKAINVIAPSDIRVESDELTYNLHIILRFEIEEGLINNTIQVKDIPEIWNSKTKEYLGFVPENDAKGCLQDIHWSFGGIGYFPSYTLGKLYAAMWFDKLKTEIPNIKDQFSKGEFTETLDWLRKNIHQYGRSKSPSQLCIDICGKPLNEENFIAHIERKIDKVYYNS
jgi:carboxypeptidase Taq